MHLPKIPDFKPPRALITDSFLGINREQGAKVNEFADAQNLSSREYPCLATAYPPRKIGNASSVLGVCYADALIRVEEGALYYAEERIEDSRITNGEKSLVCAGKRVYIFPDRLCFDCSDMSISDMERSARVDSGLLIITPCLKDYSACPIIQSDIRPEADSPDSLVGSFWLDSSCFPPKLKRYVHSESASDFIEVEPDLYSV